MEYVLNEIDVNIQLTSRKTHSLFYSQNNNKLVKGKFSWQEGYGAFSYSHSHIDNVYNYILNQEQHHLTTNFREEYLDFLKKFEVEYEEKYLFEWIE